ncbi:metallophosphoesterase family protein [Pyxidicoccus xibeiensis]|uniref:metallophosphoesterase family protein n=1 Tax=Pyxidicoccus xibeiensis TaxID=2906759 RepID=UPI0020A6E3DE|nr:metallophosphoesterase [Pyxidicoccus xibeiensis]MCP3139259.1 metallophosphoesterase [Pyxidicoccus xibeiensis]
MDRVNPSSVVVSFSNVSRMLGKESVAETVPAELAALDPAERARLQAGLEAALTILEDDQREPGVMVAPNHRPAALFQSFLAEQAATQGKVEPTKAGGYEAKFDEKDWLGWAGSFFSWWRKLKKHDWLSAHPDPLPMPSGASIAMLSDWGTGLYGAPICADSIQRAKPQVILHLGDVYYAGTETEVKERFLRFFPQVPGAIRRASNSNHEMYSGGYAYFRNTLPALDQFASYFALENDRWLLVGLDTGYAEHDLFGDQVAWLDRLMKRAKEKGQKVILTSHHQPFSIFEGQGPKLLAKVQHLLTSKQVFAWYWGHEHRCVLHAKHPAWAMYGRCIGHSGFPYFRETVGHTPVVKKNADGSQWHQLDANDGVPGALFLDGPNAFLPGHENRYGPHGYVSIQLGQDSILETVHAADGSKLYEHELR